MNKQNFIAFKRYEYTKLEMGEYGTQYFCAFHWPYLLWLTYYALTMYIIIVFLLGMFFFLVQYRGGSRGGCRGYTPLPTWDEVFFFIVTFKICLPHQSVTPFLSGAPALLPYYALSDATNQSCLLHSTWATCIYGLCWTPTHFLHYLGE